MTVDIMKQCEKIRSLKKRKKDDIVLMQNKVITTMVIRPLDDPTTCAQSVVADLQPVRLEYVGVWDGLIRYPAH